jgi:hypothetical protein
LSAPDRQTRDYGASATRFHTRQCAGVAGRITSGSLASLPVGLGPSRHGGKGLGHRRQGLGARHGATDDSCVAAARAARAVADGGRVKGARVWVLKP